MKAVPESTIAKLASVTPMFELPTSTADKGTVHQGLVLSYIPTHDNYESDVA